MIDTLDPTTVTDGEHTVEDLDQEDDPGVGGESLGETECASASALVEGSDAESTKRKRSKGEVVEDVMSKVMKTVTEGLRESDKMFLDMEEKRMKFEEQKREERKFQLQMMQILVGSSVMYL